MMPRTPFRMAGRFAALLLAGLLLLAGCTTQQVRESVQVSLLKLESQDLKQSGLAFLTPSTVTGQEEDKQALALSFFEIIERERPEYRLVSLPRALTSINRAGLAGEYRQMIEEYRLTGVLDRNVVARIGQATGARYLAQLKLSGFRQESKERWGALGFRIFETKITTARLFLQIWDSTDGSIAWEGAAEVTSAYDSIKEGTVTFRSIIEESAVRLIGKLP